MTASVLCIRGEVVESRHVVHAAVVDGEGRLRAWVGDPERVAYYRSAAKPMQALPVVEDGAADRFGFTPADLALCCASHNSEPRHLEAAAAILEKAGLGPGDLECGPHAPIRDEVAEALFRQGATLGPIHNNCSGKHGGMLALAVHHGWPTAGYLRADHPVQERMVEEVSRWTGLPPAEIGRGTDGCGVVSFAVPVRAMARSFAALTGAAGRGEEGPARIVDAMTGHPFLVAGTGRLDTDVMERAGDRVFVKTGAEGVYCAGLRGRGLGVALKVEDGDGARRASASALVEILSALDVLTADEVDALAGHHRPPIRNTRDEVVGEIRPELALERP